MCVLSFCFPVCVSPQSSDHQDVKAVNNIFYQLNKTLQVELFYTVFFVTLNTETCHARNVSSNSLSLSLSLLHVSLPLSTFCSCSLAAMYLSSLIQVST